MDNENSIDEKCSELKKNVSLVENNIGLWKSLLTILGIPGMMN